MAPRSSQLYDWHSWLVGHWSGKSIGDTVTSQTAFVIPTMARIGTAPVGYGLDYGNQQYVWLGLLEGRLDSGVRYRYTNEHHTLD